MEIIFWFSLCMIFYAYFGYVIVLQIIDVYQRILKGKKFKTSSNSLSQTISDEELPQISFIITAYNEEERITQKIENTLEQTYPAEKLEVIVASDCSNDRTDEIVCGYASKNVKLIRALERKGKENAQMYAVRAALGKILVFSDTATILEPDALRQITSNFEDPSVGCVSSEDRFIDNDGHVSGEGLYVKYEMFIRKLESRVNTLVGLSGSFFAARAEVCRHWAPDLQSDFNSLLNAVKLGMKGISDPRSIGYYKNIADERKEFQRKVRTVLRGITVLMRNRSLLNPCKYGLFSWQLMSHKICRWLVPIFMIILFAANITLLNGVIIYVMFFFLQISFYAAAAFYGVQLKTNQIKWNKTERSPNILKAAIKSVFFQIARIAHYFVSVNMSILWAWIKFFYGERATLWDPSKR
jgi:glycosyltransferase involved in cell wall biosynthesis